MAAAIELGVNTFGDVTVDPSGRSLSQAETLRHVVDEGELADQVGLDFFGVGEHHRKDFSISAPEVMLAAIAARSRRIRLGTAVTVLSTDDPVRVFERFSTLNAISSGRADVIVGRGSFTESYSLFGYDLAHYEDLFEEKLNLFAELLKNQPVTWNGQLRASLSGQIVYPPIETGHCAHGWASAEVPNRSCVPPTTGFRSFWPSSVATRFDSHPIHSSTFSRSIGSRSPCSRSARTPQVTLRRPTKRRRKSCGRIMLG